QELAAHLDGDLLGQVAVGHRGGDVGDVPHLVGEVAPHDVDVVGELLPDAGDVLDVGLHPQGPLGADQAGHPVHLGGEAVELVDHGVDGLLDLQHLAAHVDGDLARQIAGGDGGGHLGDVAHLGGEVVGHRVHVLGQLAPDPGDAAH